jgi:hypothetical protein
MNGFFWSAVTAAAKSFAVRLGEDRVRNLSRSVWDQFEPWPSRSSWTVNGWNTRLVFDISFETIICCGSTI